MAAFLITGNGVIQAQPPGRHILLCGIAMNQERCSTSSR